MLAVIVLYSVINFVIQSIIQPKFQADALGLTTTLTFLALVFWAWVLGPLGAILALPLTLLLKALFVDVDPRARWLSPLLSGVPLPELEPAPAADAPGDRTDTRPEGVTPCPRTSSPPPWKLLLLRGVIGIVLRHRRHRLAAADDRRAHRALGHLGARRRHRPGRPALSRQGLGTGQRVLFGVMALVALVVALVAFTRPDMAARRVTWVLGIWLLVRGLFELRRRLHVSARPRRAGCSCSAPCSTSSSAGSSSPTPGTAAVACRLPPRHPRHRLGHRLRRPRPRRPRAEPPRTCPTTSHRLTAGVPAPVPPEHGDLAGAPRARTL